MNIYNRIHTSNFMFHEIIQMFYTNNKRNENDCGVEFKTPKYAKDRGSNPEPIKTKNF